MDELNTNWWYEINGEQNGPVKQDELVRQINIGILHSENLIWTQGAQNWVKVKDSSFAVKKTAETPPPISGEAVNNTIVWWLAFAPLIGQLLEGVFLELFYPEPDINYNSVSSMENYTRYLTNTNFNAFWFVTLALNFYLSYRDEKKLVKAGYDTSKIGSSFLIPVYLFKRAELLKQNNAYFWVWLIMFVLTLVE